MKGRNGYFGFTEKLFTKNAWKMKCGVCETGGNLRGVSKTRCDLCLN